MFSSQAAPPGSWAGSRCGSSGTAVKNQPSKRVLRPDGARAALGVGVHSVCMRPGWSTCRLGAGGNPTWTSRFLGSAGSLRPPDRPGHPDRHADSRSSRRPLRPTSTVEPSCPATPSGSGRSSDQVPQDEDRDERTGDDQVLQHQSARAPGQAVRRRGTAASSSRTTIASAVSRARSEAGRGPWRHRRGRRRARGASLTPSPTKSTLRPARSSPRTASTLPSGGRSACGRR